MGRDQAALAAHLAPPLVVTKDEIDNVVGAIDESLTIAENEYASEIVA